jgi:hypothetical protein
MMKGMQKRARVFQAFQTWNRVGARKRRRKMTEAAMEGIYSHR